MADDELDAQLLQRWQNGDESAARIILQRYQSRLCALARARLEPRLAQRVGASDVVQSAFRSFFRRASSSEYTVDFSESLWRLLCAFTIRKVRQQHRRHRQQKRDMNLDAPVGDDEFDPTPELAGHEPTPEEAAVLQEEMERLFSRLDEEQRQLLTLCLQGYTCSEIAEQTGVSRWSVRRILDRAGKLLQERLEGDAAD